MLGAASTCRGVTRALESRHSDIDPLQRILRELGSHALPILLDGQTKHVLLAAGAAELLMRIPSDPLYREAIWDQAAGALIVEEAGGRVTDFEGLALDFTTGPSPPTKHGPHCVQRRAPSCRARRRAPAGPRVVSPSASTSARSEGPRAEKVTSEARPNAESEIFLCNGDNSARRRLGDSTHLGRDLRIPRQHPNVDRNDRCSPALSIGEDLTH